METSHDVQHDQPICQLRIDDGLDMVSEPHNGPYYAHVSVYVFIKIDLMCLVLVQLQTLKKLNKTSHRTLIAAHTHTI